MQDQLSLYVFLSGFTKRTIKMSNKVISDCMLCIYCCAIFVVCLIATDYTLYNYIMLSVVPCIYHVLSVVFIVYTLYSAMLSIV